MHTSEGLKKMFRKSAALGSALDRHAAVDMAGVARSLRFHRGSPKAGRRVRTPEVNVWSRRRF